LLLENIKLLFNNELRKVILIVLLFIFSESYPQSIIIENDFEGGNIEVLFVDSLDNIISVTPEYKNNDTRAAHFFFKTKGFNTSIPLTIILYTDESYYAPEMIGYSTDLIFWDRIQADRFSGYNKYTQLINSDSVYFAIGYPYVYTDMINLVNLIQFHPYSEISDLTISEGGKEVKLIKISDPEVDDSAKILVWTIARQHAFECNSNYVIEGLVNYIVSESFEAKRLREQAIIYILPVMDVDNTYDGGTGKDQLPVDFNRNWDSTSYWNAIIAVKELIGVTASSNSFEFFIDSHNPWPSNINPLNRLYFYTTYESGPRSYNIDFYRDVFEEISGYSIGRELIYPTIGQTAMDYIDSMYAVGMNVSMETGWVERPDDSLWTIERYVLNGFYLGEAMSDYINNLPLPGDIIIDNRDSDYVNIVGDWFSSTYIEGYYGEDYIHDDNNGHGTKSVNYLLNLSEVGFYEVFLRWTSHSERADNVPVNIFHSEGLTELLINEEKKGAGWVSMGIYYFDNNSVQKIVILNENSNGYVIADAVRLSPRKTNVSEIKPTNEVSSPVYFKLSQNYPNPFNPTTAIKYQIPELSFVNLKVYDVLGNEITTLINGEKPAGSFEVEVDGSELTSGIYFYRLQAGSFVETKKMVLIK